MSNLIRTCRLCGDQFEFTEGEQVFYLERGFRPPEYCLNCRDLRRSGQSARQVLPTSSRRSTYQTVCSICGAATSVPFKPDADRPVYCDACFAEHRRQSGVP